MEHQLIYVIDFGGQYNQLIARRVRECGVYCEVISYKTPIDKIREAAPMGIIFTGGPNSVYLDTSPTISSEIFSLGVPVLGICYGAQLMASRPQTAGNTARPQHITTAPPCFFQRQRGCLTMTSRG